MQKVAIIGTGITALSIGYHLPRLLPSVEITYIDKGRKVGGRLATRRTRTSQSTVFDHGAPFFPKQHLKADLFNLLTQLKCIKELTLKCQYFGFKNQFQKVVYVGSNGIQSISDSLFKQVKHVGNTHFDCRIQKILKDEITGNYILTQQKVVNKIVQSNRFNWVFSCIPYEQAKALKQTQFDFTTVKQQVGYLPHWVIMLSVPKGFITSQDIDYISFQKQVVGQFKCGVKQNKKFNFQTQNEIQNWVFYMSDVWGKSNKDLSKQQVQKVFINILTSKLNKQIKANNIYVHRWLYSRPQIGTNDILRKDNLVFAGDWVGPSKSVGECWELGKEIVEKLIKQTNNQQQNIKSNL